MKIKFVVASTPDTRLSYLKSRGCSHQDAVTLMELDRQIEITKWPERRELKLQRMEIWNGRVRVKA